MTAEKIKIEVADVINMFEVKVFWNDSEMTLTSTSQSSTLKNKDKFEASKAADNDMSTFSHTEQGTVANPSWWEGAPVDGVDFFMNKIVIENRWCGGPQDSVGCLCRLSNAIITLTDTSDTVVYTEQLGDTCGMETITVDVCGEV